MDESPLRSKAVINDSLPSSITTHRKRRESLLQQNESDDQSLSTSSSIVTMLAEKRKAKAAERLQQGEDGRDLEKANLKIPPEELRGSAGGMGLAETDIKEQKLLARSKRSSTSSRELALSEGEVLEVETTRKFATATSRRRQSSLGLGSATSSNDIAKRGITMDRTGRGSISTTGPLAPGLVDAKSTLKKSTGTARTVTPVDLESGNDKVAGRRRSMML
jgi:hypothetical protein